MHNNKHREGDCYHSLTQGGECARTFEKQNRKSFSYIDGCGRRAELLAYYSHFEFDYFVYINKNHLLLSKVRVGTRIFSGWKIWIFPRIVFGMNRANIGWKKSRCIPQCLSEKLIANETSDQGSCQMSSKRKPTLGNLIFKFVFIWDEDEEIWVKYTLRQAQRNQFRQAM